MFTKKPKVSKKNLKKSIVSANDRLKAANSRLELDIEAGRERIKSIGEDYDAYKKALEDLSFSLVLTTAFLRSVLDTLVFFGPNISEKISRLHYRL